MDASLAQDLTALEHLYPVLDLVDVAERSNRSLHDAASAYFAVDEQLALSQWRQQIGRLPADTQWQTQARASARDDVYAIASQITLSMLTQAADTLPWAQRHSEAIARIASLRHSIAGETPDLAPVSVVLREMRQLV